MTHGLARTANGGGTNGETNSHSHSESERRGREREKGGDQRTQGEIGARRASGRGKQIKVTGVGDERRHPPEDEPTRRDKTREETRVVQQPEGGK
jgi:hypothetical protein